ncbi:PTS system beta-glucoside-specific EIIBCA component [compost metagenome]
MLKAKSRKVRSVAGPATISALFGVTEPAIYGISLPYKKPFIMAGIGGALAGGITAFMGAKMFGFGGTAIFAAPLFINPEGIDNSFYAFLISSAVALIVATVLTYFFGFNKSMETIDTSASNSVKTASAVSRSTSVSAASSHSSVKHVYSPLQGTIIPLQEVKDEAFASGALGDGFAIIPTSNEVYAPFDGTVVTIAKSKHAIAVLSDTGVELLIHVGINTVKLKGTPFDIKVAENETVKKGQRLAVVNWDIIKDNNYDVTTPVIVTNTADHSSIELQDVGNSNVNAGQLVLNIK